MGKEKTREPVPTPSEVLLRSSSDEDDRASPRVENVGKAVGLRSQDDPPKRRGSEPSPTAAVPKSVRALQTTYVQRYNVLIASPADVATERDQVFQTIAAWNGSPGNADGRVVFVPLMLHSSSSERLISEGLAH